jgi:hypothetical protein
MGDPPPYDDTAGAPRWVKVFGIIALVVVLLFLVLMFARGPGGRHGPSRHMRSSDAGSQTRFSSLVVADDAPSEGRCG